MKYVDILEQHVTRNFVICASVLLGQGHEGSEVRTLVRNLLLGSRGRWENIINVDLREICCEDGRWMELAQDPVQWQALVLAVLNLRVLLPDSWFSY
jgi:hypothetical protein